MQTRCVQLRFFWLAMAAGVHSPAVADGPELSVQLPSAAINSPDKRNGVLTLDGSTYAYLPKGLTDAPAPVLVVLHGARDDASDMLRIYRDQADRFGIILFIPNAAKENTWDMVLDLRKRLGTEFNITPRYGRDLRAIDAGLADLFSKVAVDPARVGVTGFSNGATYALSIGTANPHLFRTVIAHSPGPAFMPRIDPSQRIFISHGRHDSALPYSVARGHVSRLRVKNAKVVFEEFDGGHEIPPAIQQKALEFFLSGK